MYPSLHHFWAKERKGAGPGEVGQGRDSGVKAGRFRPPSLLPNRKPEVQSGQLGCPMSIAVNRPVQGPPSQLAAVGGQHRRCGGGGADAAAGGKMAGQEKDLETKKGLLHHVDMSNDASSSLIVLS